MKISTKDEMVDIAAPEVVEITISKDGKTIWINIDGICRLRCCRVKEMIILCQEFENPVLHYNENKKLHNHY